MVCGRQDVHGRSSGDAPAPDRAGLPEVPRFAADESGYNASRPKFWLPTTLSTQLTPLWENLNLALSMAARFSSKWLYGLRAVQDGKQLYRSIKLSNNLLTGYNKLGL